LTLIKYINNLEYEKEWKTPLGVFLTITSTLLTADFKSFFNLESECVKTIFLIMGVISLALMVKAYFFDKKKKISIEELVKKIEGF
jgi:hypothetical protein